MNKPAELAHIKQEVWAKFIKHCPVVGVKLANDEDWRMEWESWYAGYEAGYEAGLEAGFEEGLHVK